MAVLLTRPYQGFATNTIFVGPDDTESALVSQGYATALSAPVDSVSNLVGGVQYITSGGNTAPWNPSLSGNPSVPQGPRILPNVPINAFASLGTNTTRTAGTMYFSEIYVPHYNLWTGIGFLNGATVGTDNLMVMLYSSDGRLIANSAVAGELSAGANAFQNIAFTSTVYLAPGRYFGAVQGAGTTATIRTQAATMGGNMMTGSVAGTFGTVPATITVPTTFTADVGPIFRLYV